MTADEEKVYQQLVRENSRLRGDLLTIAYRISHDLRTPLGGIIGAAEALKEILVETEPAALQLVASSLDSADELSQLIKHVSFVVKATARPLPLQPTNMGEVVFATLQRLESRILNAGMTVSQPDSWPMVAGVAEWLEVVWWHLLVKILPYGGAKTQINLGWKEQGGQLFFWITDNGLSISEHPGDQLFKPFNLLHETNDASGLGFSIVQRLVELQGGSCGYESDLQNNTYFFFTLSSLPPKEQYEAGLALKASR
jgi:K+-sensing histidine kinase KdpD